MTAALTWLGALPAGTAKSSAAGRKMTAPEVTPAWMSSGVLKVWSDYLRDHDYVWTGSFHKPRCEESCYVESCWGLKKD
jgi:hypothetical protein